MSLASARQMKGLGFSFQASAQSVIALGEVVDAAEAAAPEAALGEFAKPALDEVQPGARGRREVQMPALLAWLGEPGADLGRFVRGEVVEHDMDLQLARHGLVDLLEEGQHISAGVSVAEVVMTSPLAMLSAANRSVVPWRL